MTRQRMDFVDNLRCMVIVLVVFQHAAVTYSGLGSWFYKEPRPMSQFSLLLFGVYQSFFQAFAMGLLFLLAGYFAAKALHDKGPGFFAKSRVTRLGAPTLFFMLTLHPLTVYYLSSYRDALSRISFLEFYSGFVSSPIHVLGATGPMWFALALLAFCLVFAALVRVFGTLKPRAAPDAGAPNFSPWILVGLIALVSAGAYGLRIRWPIGTAVLNMQLCFFSQYVVLFLFGVLMWRNAWMEALTPALGKRCLKAVLLAEPAHWAILWYVVASPDGLKEFSGGGTGISLAFAVWESYVGVLMSVGLIAVFRQRWNSREGRLGFLPDDSFAVYVLHPPVLVLLSRVLTPADLPALAQFVLLCVVAVPVNFGFARLVREISWMRWLLRS